MNLKEDASTYDATYLLKNLKEQTKQIHGQVEEKNLARFIVDHSITQKQYRSLISHNYHVYLSLESYLKRHKDLLHSALQALLNYDKSNALTKDLESMESETMSEKITFPLNPEKMDLIGAMYVMEGSMLGGMLIANHLKKCHNLDGITEFHFYNTNAKNNLSRWKSFRSALEVEVYSQSQIKKAIETAKDVFTSFEIS